MFGSQNNAEESENLASLSSGALQAKLHEVNELQRQSECYLQWDHLLGFIIDYRLLSNLYMHLQSQSLGNTLWMLVCFAS